MNRIFNALLAHPRAVRAALVLLALTAIVATPNLVEAQSGGSDCSFVDAGGFGGWYNSKGEPCDPLENYEWSTYDSAFWTMVWWNVVIIFFWALTA
jgi:hypothetical protein